MNCQPDKTSLICPAQNLNIPPLLSNDSKGFKILSKINVGRLFWIISSGGNA